MWCSHKQTRNTGIGETKRMQWERCLSRDRLNPLLSSPLMVHYTNSTFLPDHKHRQTISCAELLTVKSGWTIPILFNPEKLYHKVGSKRKRSGQGEGQTWPAEDTFCKNNQIIQVAITATAVLAMLRPHLTLSAFAWLCSFRYLWEDEIWFRKSSLNNTSMSLKDYQMPKYWSNVPNISSDTPTLES